jgi:hypothetical protein
MTVSEDADTSLGLRLPSNTPPGERTRRLVKTQKQARSHRKHGAAGSTVQEDQLIPPSSAAETKAETALGMRLPSVAPADEHVTSVVLKSELR